jgi:hypothetical protein
MRPSPRSAALVCAALLAAALGGCGEEEGEPKREGLGVHLGGLQYNVFITRQLNVRDVEDRGYYQGRDAPPGAELYGVFIEVCNNSESGGPKPAADEFKVVDTQGNEFEPLALPASNLFAYRARDLGPRACIPEEGTIAETGPTSGAILIFQLPNTASENRPLELEIARPLGADLEGPRQAKIELDL